MVPPCPPPGSGLAGPTAKFRCALWPRKWGTEAAGWPSAGPRWAGSRERAGMAGARGCPQAGSGERALAELLLEFSRAQYRAKDGGGGGVERIEKRCLELFGRDYCYSLIQNVNGEICGHYPRQIVFLEYESTDRERNMFESTVQVSKLQDLINRSKMARCRGRFVCPVILYKGKVKLHKHICLCVSLQDYVDAPLSIPVSLTRSLNIDWSEYQSWDLVQQTQNYLKLLISLINGDDDSGLLVHCISGWDRTPLFVALLRLSLWADGLIHASLEPAEILYLTVAAAPVDSSQASLLSPFAQIFFFCFNFLKHITSEEFSAVKLQRRKSLLPGFTVEEICMLKQRDRGSTTSLSSDFSLVLESSPGAAGSFTSEAVELMPAGAQTQAAWRKSRTSSPQTVLWSRTPQSEDRPPYQEAKSSSSSSSNHSDTFLRVGSSPLEVPKPRSVDHSLPGSSVSTDFGSWQMVTGCGSIQEHAILSTDAALPGSFPDELPNSCLLVPVAGRESRLEEVRSAFLATYSSTIGLKAAPSSPSGALGGLLEQFARGVGLRGSSSTL
uniref:Myotubularin related protein 14 n=1 Tax=Terrapene triunguis TaxID=2587831 RepID=A0A674JP52_9SAUR